MTIIDFPQGGRTGRAARAAGPAAATASLHAHPTSVLAHRRSANRASGPPTGAPPTGRWRTTYEELAACCAEVVAAGAPGRTDTEAEWAELLDWIRGRLAVLDVLKQGGAS